VVRSSSKFCRAGDGFSYLLWKTWLLFLSFIHSEPSAGVEHDTGTAVILCVPIYKQDSQLENWKSQNTNVQPYARLALFYFRDLSI